MSDRNPENDDTFVADSEATEGVVVDGDVSELTELLQRLQADFDNYRKRTRVQNDAAAERATASFARALLPALDALDALVRSPDPMGAALTKRLFIEALASFSVVRIEESGVDFEPSIHEPVNAGEHNVVAKVFRPGYQLGATLLRPASVELN